MALWVIFAFLTAIAALIVLRPFWRPRPSAAAKARDVEVYKQQLQEIEDEFARDLLGKTELDAARIEVSRRLLAAAERDAPLKPAVKPRVITPYALVAVLPLVAVSLYGIYGSPQLPDQPHAERAAAGESVEALVARVEERLDRQPEDGMGWNVIAPVYMRLGRYADAANAFRNVARLLGENADRLANLGEALTLANDGVVDADARAALDRALQSDARNAKSRFWIAVAEEQAGRKTDAIALYRKLQEEQLPPAVAKVVGERIAMLEGGGATPGAPAGAGGGVDAAQINQMVSGLADRLKQDGTDLNGWLMLVRAYTVLGRKDEALGALQDARGRFSGNSDALSQIDALAKSLGLLS